MRIAVVGDTHGIVGFAMDKLQSIKEFDLLLHLGDYCRDAEKISDKLNVKTITIKGNGDLDSKYNEDELLEVVGKKIFMTHGHRYGVHRNLNKLYYKGLELGADIILYGHTHVPLILEEDGISIMNPGSPTNPRGNDPKLTFGIIEIEENIKLSIVEI